MSSPDEERGPVGGPRSDQAAAKRTDLTRDRTPHLARLTWNGHPGLTTEYARRIGWLNPEFLRLLRDAEAGALAVHEAIGRRAARRLALELLKLSEEVA